LSESPKIDPTRLLIRDFAIERTAWSTYVIDHKKVKGKLKLLSVLADLFEIPEDLIPKDKKPPQFQPLISTLSRFVNEGEKGESDTTPFTQEEYERRVKEDITDSVVQMEEPVSEYLIRRDPPLVFRMETKLARVFYVKFRWNSFGDPILIAESNTTHTTAEYKTQNSDSGT
jgi:hypothetical protein